MDPPPPFPSTPVLPCSAAGFRSTFDRLPYGCLLFLYRLDLAFHRAFSKLRVYIADKFDTARARTHRRPWMEHVACWEMGRAERL